SLDIRAAEGGFPEHFAVVPEPDDPEIAQTVKRRLFQGARWRGGIAQQPDRTVRPANGVSEVIAGWPAEVALPVGGTRGGNACDPVIGKRRRVGGLIGARGRRRSGQKQVITGCRKGADEQVFTFAGRDQIPQDRTVRSKAQGSPVHGGTEVAAGGTDE